MSKRNEIRIVNPVPGGNERTSKNRAKRFVSKGRAKWVGATAIEFIADDSRHRAAVTSAIATITAKHRSFCYDDGLATPEQIAGLPVAGDPTTLLKGKPTGNTLGTRPVVVLARKYTVESVA